MRSCQCLAVGATTGLGGGFGTTGGFGTSTTGTTGGFGTAGGVGGGFGTTGGLGGGTLGGGFGGLGATTGLGGLSSGLTAQQQDNVVVTGETVFTQLPVAMQQKIWEVYQRMLDHRRNADVIKKFSTQPTDLDDQTKVRPSGHEAASTMVLIQVTASIYCVCHVLYGLRCL